MKLSDKIYDFLKPLLMRGAGIGLILLLLTACTADKDDFNYGFDEGDAISFMPYAPAAMQTTRGYDAINTDITTKYAPTNKNYVFTVGIYKDESGTPTCLGEATYKPQSEEDPAVSVLTSQAPLYWPSVSDIKYGFKATANYGELPPDQTTDETFFSADKVTGYGYVPLYDSNNQTDKLGTETDFNFYTPKEWKGYNEVLYGSAEGHIDYKTVPLFIRHDRVWITVILKAGKGVRREALAYETAAADIETTISSYSSDGTTETKIQPLASKIKIHYDADVNGGAEDVFTTQYDAIVEPFNYWTYKTKPICNIAISTQKFSYCAGNDTEHATDELKEASYNLPAGKHLTITALLEDNRVIPITAIVEDWTEKITTTMVNDFGMLGDPIFIENKQQLIDFLKNTSDNKTGNYAIVKNSIDLDAAVTGYETLWIDVTTSKDLKATLNLAGSTIKTSSQFLNNIDGGNLLNGTIEVKGSGTATSYVANENSGKIEQISVTLAKDNLGQYATAKASVAGMVVENKKYIFNCSSEIPVYATTGYAGGIAGTSSDVQANIQDCRVIASVKGTDGVTKAGGIVGKATGTLSNNTFDYGITISQDADKFKNIIGEIDGSITAGGNKWPTNDADPIGENATDAADRVTGVIDCQADLSGSLTNTDKYNNSDAKCKIVHDFELDNSWDDSYDINYELLGGNKVITTNGKRIFKDIYNNISDVTIHVNANISNTVDNSSTASALGYELKGNTIENIRVKTAANVYIEAANPAGILYLASDNATISNCQFNGKLKLTLQNSVIDGRVYVGGIVAQTDGATITGCVCHSGKDMIISGTPDNEGENVICGGIVGAVKYQGASQLIIKDCKSKFYVSDAADQIRKGAIVGSIKYALSSDNYNAVTTGSTGNWWEFSADNNNDKHFNVPIATGGWVTAQGLDVTDLIGKRNAVQPAFDTDW